MTYGSLINIELDLYNINLFIVKCDLLQLHVKHIEK